MLDNKWIISKKEQLVDKNGYLYTLMLLDGNSSLFGTNVRRIYSEKSLNVGDFSDCNLNPLSAYYNPGRLDVATVEYTVTYKCEKSESVKISLFGGRSGCFDAIMSESDFDFPIKRGDTVSVFRFFPKCDMPQDQSRCHSFMFKIMQNLTTGRKSPEFEYITDNYVGNFERAVIVGMGCAGTMEKPATKAMFVTSPKFGCFHMLFSSNQTLFFTRAGDKLLIKRNPVNGTAEVLRNITADAIRAAYITNQR